jgi:pilus assembly protein Flp/PilA
MGKLVEYMGDESGASAAEYALILAIIAAAIVGALVALRNSINTALTNTTSAINNSAA